MKRKRRREPGDSFVDVYLRLRLTCLLLSAICCCRLCLFRVLLDTCPICFLQFTALPAFCNCHLFFYLQFVWGVGPSHSPVELSTRQVLLQDFPSTSTLTEVVTLLPSLVGFSISSSCGEVPLSHLRWSFPHDSCCYKLSPLQGCWTGAITPSLSAWLVYLQFA
jgi:hypothetical protein